MTRTTSVLAALGLLVASIIGGALVSGLVSGDDKERALPAREDTIPILAPSKTVPVAADTSPTDVAAALVGSGGAGAADLPLSESVTEVSPAAVDTLREHATEARSEGARYGLIDLSSILLRFFDDACDEEHGERSNPDGTCSTVLSLIDPPPFQILEVVVGPEAAAREECGATIDIGPEDTGAYGVLIISNNPGDFTITSGPDGGALAEPRETTTDPEQVAQWQSWLESDLTPGTGGREVHTCGVIFAEPPVTTPWTVHVDGTFGTADPPETDSADARFDAIGITPETRPRPPVTVSPIDDNHVHVGIPAFGPRTRADARIQLGFVSPAGIRADYPNTPAEAAELCDATDPSGFREVSHTGPERLETIPGTDDPAYLYDPSYSFYAHFRSEGLAAGARYALCVIWTDGGAVIDRAAVVVVAPARYHWSATLAGLQFEAGPEAPSGVTFEVDTLDRILGLPGAEPRCRVTPVSSAPVERIWAPELELDGMCRSDPTAASSDIRWRDEFVLRLIIRHGEEFADAWVTYPRTPCVLGPDCSYYFGDLYRIAVPGIPRATASVSIGFSAAASSTGATDWEIGSEAAA